jgi:predicted nucleic acid-binding protein
MILVLDTNAYSGLMRGDARFTNPVRAADRLILPAIVLGELLYGFRLGNRNRENREQLDQFLKSAFVDFRPVNRAVCERYALLMQQLRKKGRPIPSNDVWIAAHTLAEGAELLTKDEHFSEIDGLSLYEI